MAIVNRKQRSVILSEEEIIDAMRVGIDRSARCISRGSKSRSEYKNDEDKIYNSIVGSCGERALAAYLGIEWIPLVDTFTRIPDVGELEVRTRTKDYYDLIIRDCDDDNKPYVLVLGNIVKFRIVGWIYAREGKKEKWKHVYGGGRPSYFVPQNFLKTSFACWRKKFRESGCSAVWKRTCMGCKGSEVQILSP